MLLYQDTKDDLQAEVLEMISDGDGPIVRAGFETAIKRQRITILLLLAVLVLALVVLPLIFWVVGG